MNAAVSVTRMAHRLTKYCPIDHRNIVEKTLIKDVNVSVEPDRPTGKTGFTTQCTLAPPFSCGKRDVKEQ